MLQSGFLIDEQWGRLLTSAIERDADIDTLNLSRKIVRIKAASTMAKGQSVAMMSSMTLSSASRPAALVSSADSIPAVRRALFTKGR